MSISPLLIVGPSWVGDMIMAQSLFRVLKARQPDRAIDLLAPAWSLPVIERMPEVRRGIVLPLGHGELGFGKRRQLGQSLKPTAYGQAIVLPRSMKAALVPFFAGIPRRSGFRGEMRYGVINDRRPFDKTVLNQTVKRFVALGLEAGEALPEIPEPKLTVSADNQERLLKALGLTAAGGVVAMMPGAEYGPAKCWPVEYFAELAAALNAAGKAVWVLGSAKEVALGEAIAARSEAHNLCGRTELADVIDLLAMAQYAVSNDSGLMHVAAAAGSHVIGIYGSTSPGFTPPLTSKKTLHYLDLECSPCFQRECPLGHLRCLREILPAKVLAGIS
ncbi:MAG: lipopolysaccharide heptosyltransferase II [Woeseia sp.]